ncbi:tyrosine-protein phosphatase [Patulibacter sp. S7RM1-6]
MSTTDDGGSRVASRTVHLAGADNVRDLGDLPTRDGGRTRRGMLLRGALLARLVEEDVHVLVRDLGLRTVVDLRTRGEVRHEPGSWLEHQVAWVHAPLRLGDFPAVPTPGADHAHHYLGFLEEGPGPIVLALRTLMAAEHRPALLHCAAGKDRTGVVSALALDVLDVPADAIAADYAQTGAALARVLERLSRIEPYRRVLRDADADAQRPRAETMHRFLAGLHERFGGATAWLVAQGVPRDEIEAFRRALVAPPAPERA